MKGVSEFVIVLIILIIVIASILVVWLFYNSMFSSVTTSEGTSSLGEALSSCMKIDSVKSNKVYLRNCGNGILTNNSLGVYFDEGPISFSMAPSYVGKGDVGIVTLYNLKLWNMSLGENHKIRISTKAGEVERYVKTALPDSCVLALDFEENTTSIVYDKSGYGNNGTSFGGPVQANGRFGKAIDVDGINDYVNFTTFDLPIPAITIGFWIKAKINDIDNWAAPYGTGSPAYHKCYNNQSLNPLTGLADIPECFRDKSGFYSKQANKHQDGWWFGIKFYNTTLPHTQYQRTQNYVKGTLLLDKWKYVHQVWNGTTAWGYVNGILSSANLDDTNNYTSTVGFEPDWIGMRLVIGSEFSSGANFNGTIDEFRIFNKALTPDEVVDLRLVEST